MSARPRYGLMLLTLLAILLCSSFIATRPAQTNSSVIIVTLVHPSNGLLGSRNIVELIISQISH
jgi:hypothetical protein